MRFLVLVLMSGAAWAGEYAILASGGRLHVDSHESDGARVKLYLGAGTIEMDAAEVRSFEPEAPAPPTSLAAAPSAPPPERSNSSAEELADAAARKYGLPPHLVWSVMKAESGLHPQAVSPKGAIGLMQLMPATAESLGANARDPVENVDAGARYLRALLEKYGGALRHALAAYNAGPAAVEKYGGVPPFAETLEYIRRVEREWKRAE
jgi:soluble lytic murein transglycosylase-like protein